MASVQLSGDAIAPIHGDSDHGGVYSIRQRHEAAQLADHRSLNSDVEDLKREGDFKQKQELIGWMLLWLAWQATGLILPSQNSGIAEW